MLRIFGIVGYVLLAFLILSFIFSNRMAVEVDFFPLGHSAEFPLYVLLSIIFVGGLLIGLLHSATVWASMRTKLKRAQRAIAQLEKEIAARPPTV